jgi:hypothetical protein
MSVVTERLYDYYSEDIAKLIGYHKWCRIKPQLECDIKEVLNSLEDNTNVVIDIPLFEYSPKLVEADLSKLNSQRGTMKLCFELSKDMNLNLSFDGVLEMNVREFNYYILRSNASIIKAGKTIISNLDFHDDIKNVSFINTIRKAILSIISTRYYDNSSYFLRLQKSLNTTPIYYASSKDVNTILNIVAYGLPTNLGDAEYEEFIKGLKQNPAIAGGKLNYDSLHNALLISKISPIKDLTISKVANIYLNDLLSIVDEVVVNVIQAHEQLTKLITSVASPSEIQPFIEAIPNYIAEKMDWGNVQSDANHPIIISLANAQRLKERVNIYLEPPSVSLPSLNM